MRDFFIKNRNYSVVIFPSVGEGTVRAVLYAAISIAEISRAVEKIKRTIAKKAVKIVFILTAVAGKELTCRILKEFIAHNLCLFPV